MTTTTLTNPSVTLTRSADQEVIVFPNGSVLYGEDVIKQVDAILGGVRTTVTQQEIHFLANGDIESVLTYVQNLFSNITSRRK